MYRMIPFRRGPLVAVAIASLVALSATARADEAVPDEEAPSGEQAAAIAAPPIDDRQLSIVVAQRVDVNKESVESQGRVDAIHDETDKLATEYHRALQQIDALRVYNHRVEGVVADQEATMADLQRQIDEVELVSREVVPLMQAMVETLDQFVGLDVPFLLTERRGRIARLRSLWTDANVSDAERYRLITEAYQIENEYGRTIEAYQDQIKVDDQERTVDFLRVGRIVFMYQTLDGIDTGVWDQEARSWLPADEYRTAVRQGIRMARKQAAPDLLRLPVPAARAAR